MTQRLGVWCSTTEVNCEQDTGAKDAWHGAGIGGLAAGVALAVGCDIRIFERAPVPLEIGFGVGLAPNAIAALRELGVADAVLPRAVAPFRGEIRQPDGTPSAARRRIRRGFATARSFG